MASQAKGEVPNYLMPRQGRIEADPGASGFIPLNFILYNPNTIILWRSQQFEEAVGTVLSPDTTTHELTEWKNACIDAAVSASNFDPEEGVTVLPKRVQRLARLLGRAEFLRLYDTAPPPEIIDFMLEESARRKAGIRGSMIVNLSLITAEVLRGRLDWEGRFAEAGVISPDEYIENTRSRKALERTLPKPRS